MAARGELDPPKLVALAAQYGTELDLSSVPELMAAHGVVFTAGAPHK